MQVPANAKAAAISVRVRKADGRIVDYGIVSEFHRSPWRRIYLAFRRRLGLPIRPQHVFG